MKVLPSVDKNCCALEMGFPSVKTFYLVFGNECSVLQKKRYSLAETLLKVEQYISDN